MTTTNERLWAKVDASGDCWEWTAALDNDGYGRFGVNGHNRYAHRVIYETLVGPIPDGLEIDHLCRVRHCVKPDHMEPVPHDVNVQRGFLAEATRARRLARTHCNNGHPWPDDPLLDKNGYRVCRQCVSAKNRRAYLKRKESSGG